MTAASHPMAWADHAACAGRDPDEFHPVGADAEQLALIRLRPLCHTCTVYRECHDWALHHETEGIWAATTPTQRRRLRRSLGIAQPNGTGLEAQRRTDEITGATPPYRSLTTAPDPPEKSQPRPA